jgi:integrase
MVKLRPYVVAVNHVPGCPRLESGQGGRKQGRRRCAPGCKRETDGWEVDLALRLPDGTPIRERVKAPVSGRSAALRWAQEREGQILAQKGRKPKQARQVPTVAEFKPRFIEGHVKANRLKPSSAEAYESVFRTHLEPEFGSMRLDAIGDERVQRFKGELVEDGMANKSINNVLTALSVMLKRAVDWKVIDTMPCRIRLLKWDKGEVAFYDFAEYRRLVEAAAAIDPRIELLVLLGGDAGLRRGEAIALEWTDVDLRRRTMHVQSSSWNGQVTLPKGGRTRRLPLTERLAHALHAHRHLKAPRVLYYDDGAPPTNKEIRIWMERAQRRAVLPANGGFHILRHTFCSHLAMQGATAKAIQELAGHQDLTTTQRYMHLSPAHKDAAIRLLDRRPDDDGPLDYAAPAAPLRSGRTGEEGTAPSAVRAISVGEGLETGLRPEPESSRSE